jgi:YegS/Rv2252/BmrU family lipid kinase
MAEEGPPEHVFVVLNPTSGAGAGRRVRAELEVALRERGIDFRIEETRGPGHAMELAEAAARDGAPAIAAAGGDGTIHEVVNGLLRAGTRPALCLVPIGTGNDFVKVVPGTQRRTLAYDTIAHGRIRAFDAAIMRWRGGEEYFVNAAGTGIDVEVVRQIEALRGLPGAAMYVLGLARALFRYRPVHLRVTPPDGKVIERRVMLAAVSNGKCLGGAFRLTPDAKPDDGLLDLCIVESISLASAVRVSLKVLRGTHAGHASVTTARGSAFDIASEGDDGLLLQLDGELRRIDDQRVRIEVVPGALRVFAARDPGVSNEAG